MKDMIRLAIPVILAYLGQLAMQIVDMIAVGHVSATALGAVGLGSAFFYVFMVFGMGMLTGLDFLVAHAFGAGNRNECRQIYVQAMILSTLLAIPLTVIPWFLSYHLHAFGAAPDVAREAGPYLRIVAASMWSTLLFIASRQYLQALGVAKPAMIILVLANVLNAIFNYVFVFGHWGAPRLETYGSGLATFLSRIFTVVSILVVVVVWDKPLREGIKKRIYRWDMAIIKRLCKLGLPASLQLVLEVGAFSMATMLAARLTATDLAAHQIVLNTASFTFMVPMGISAATAVLIGQSLGRNNPEEAARFGWRGLILGVSFMSFSAVMLFSFPEKILSIYSKDPLVLAQAQTILILAALFQIFDGTQVIGGGALRGVADTKSSMMANLAGHWVLGLPVGIYLCFGHHMQLRGLWTGLAVGLLFVSICLMWRWSREASLLKQGIIPGRVLRS